MQQTMFQNQGVVIIGATSAIAQAISRVLATRGARLFLVARAQDRLNAVAADLAVRSGKDIQTYCLDINEVSRHEEMFVAAEKVLGVVDTVVIAHGTLPNQKACEISPELTLSELSTNATSTIALLTLVANRFEARGKGYIIVLSSVAGDRGRQSNYVYGAAKGAVSIFLQGLRNRLHGKGVKVITVKPGFVDTPMTAGFEKNFLWAKPDAVGSAIVRAVEKGKEVIYVPWFWQCIMMLIKAIPEAWFKRLRL
jgi:short-subunit dehydrogenase